MPKCLQQSSIRKPKTSSTNTFETLKYLQQTILWNWLFRWNLINYLKQYVAQKVAIILGCFILPKNHNKPPKVAKLAKILVTLIKNDGLFFVFVRCKKQPVWPENLIKFWPNFGKSSPKHSTSMFNLIYQNTSNQFWNLNIPIAKILCWICLFRWKLVK